MAKLRVDGRALIIGLVDTCFIKHNYKEVTLLQHIGEGELITVLRGSSPCDCWEVEGDFAPEKTDEDWMSRGGTALVATKNLIPIGDDPDAVVVETEQEMPVQ